MRLPPSRASARPRLGAFAGRITLATKSAWSAACGALMSGRPRPKRAARLLSPSSPFSATRSTSIGNAIRATAISSRAIGAADAPLNLDNLSRRVLSPALDGGWKGWHGFRRGLGTNLYRLGVPPKVIQEILRHADVSTTQTHYIVVDHAETQAAMKKLERAVGKEWAKAKKRATAKLKKQKSLGP